jgi:sugar lactone lactonase YvrE
MGLDANGRVYVTDNVRLRVVRFLPDGSFDMEIGVPGMPQPMGEALM